MKKEKKCFYRYLVNYEKMYFSFFWDFSRPENIPVRYDKGI